MKCQNNSRENDYIAAFIPFITFLVGQKFTYTQLVFGSIAFKLFNFGQTFQVAFHKLPTISWVNFVPFLLTELVRRNGPKFDQLIVGSLWNATRNVWPKLNNLKAMLSNTNWVYVNLWPTGNVMKEIKAEINHSLYYYSDISHC